jgi:hypothetical protein
LITLTDGFDRVVFHTSINHWHLCQIPCVSPAILARLGGGHTKAGQGVSSDGLEAGNPGRPLMTKGQPSNVRWVDHMTSFIYVTFHRSKAVNELLKSKQEFEQYAAMYNVKIKTIWADKGVYTAQAFP